MQSTHSQYITADGQPGFNLGEWLHVVAGQYSSEDYEAIGAAASFCIEAHGDQKRASGDPYFLHPFAVASILIHLKMDADTIRAALLHDVVEDTDITIDMLREQFGDTVAMLVDGVTKMDIITDYPDNSGGAPRDKVNAESLRKLLLAMVEDVRVVLIKLADRLHNMRTLSFLDREKQLSIARETLDIFSPLANRLGIWQIKWELEDLSLRYLEPETYKNIARMLDEKRISREKYIDNVLEIIRKELDKAGIKAEVSGRPKHIYSIWKKMKRKGVGFHEIFDVRAVRIITESVADCYAALGIVHTMWKHIPKEFDDYIATPKENLYQSIHTAVIGPEGKTLEVQIRTREMHEHAELGVAAHWVYKEGQKQDAAFESKIAWLRQLLEWKEEEENAGDFIDRFKAEVYEDRVYVLTPMGKVVDLSRGATPLDFAYHIHTDVGHRCRGAKVNGRIVPLTYELRSGDQVEILTTRNGTPSRDWLNPYLGYLKTSRARAKVRAWFRQQDQEKNIAAGRLMLDRELNRLGVSNEKIETLSTKMGFGDVSDFLSAIGRGEVSPGKIAGYLQKEVESETHEDTELLRHHQPRKSRNMDGDVSIHGVGNLMTNIARCCKPLPGDEIVGYITKGRGVSIHRKDCPNILRLGQEDRGRLIQVSWGGRQESNAYPVDIHVLAYDRQGLLRDITAIFTNEKVNVLAVNTMTDIKDHMARMSLTVEIVDIDQLSRILMKISQLPNVIEVKRKR